MQSCSFIVLYMDDHEVQMMSIMLILIRDGIIRLKSVVILYSTDRMVLSLMIIVVDGL